MYPTNGTRREQELTLLASDDSLTDEVLDHIMISSLVFLRGQEDGERRKEHSKLKKSAEKFETLVTIMSFFGVQG